MPYTAKIKKVNNFHNELENNFISTDIEWIPLTSVQISKQKEENLLEFFEALADDDDVQNIFSNLEIKNN